MDEIKYQIKWNPQEDITVFELAQCMPYIFNGLQEVGEWDILDETITRHFTVTEYNYGELIRKTKEKMSEFADQLEGLFGEEED